MKAVVYYDKQDIRVEDIPLPEVKPGALLVKVEACAMCGSDFKTFNNGNPRMNPPITMGHEFCGTIETIGDGVSGFSIGDKIVMATSVSCRTCFYCKKGWTNLCIDLRPMGFYYPGGMAEYVLIPARAVANGHVVKVPASMDPVQAAMAEPVSCAVNAAENCRISRGDTVVVVGAGPLGIMNLFVARSMGASKVILAQREGKRYEMAQQFPADRLVNTTTEDLVQVIKEETDGIGADCAIIAAPSPEPQEQSLDLVRKKGSICLFASLPVGKNLLSLDSRKIHYNELNVVGASDSTAEHVRKAVSILADPAFPTDKLANPIIPLTDVNHGFDIMKNRAGMRVVLRP